MYTVNTLTENIFDWQPGALSKTNAGIKGHISDGDLMILVSTIIIQLGVPAHIKGYAYLREAIIIKVNDPQAVIPITKTLYPSVAKKFHSSAEQVERAIRHAIEMSWNRMNDPYREPHFSYQFFRFEKKPTNSELIAMIADYIILFYF